MVYHKASEMNERTDRIAKMVLIMLGESLPQLLPEDLYPFISIVGATVSKDLSFVDVRVQIVETEKIKSEELFSCLLEARHHLQKYIAGELHMRKTPRLRLHHDQGLDHSQRINDLLQQIKNREEMET